MNSNRRVKMAILIPHVGAGGAEATIDYLLQQISSDAFDLTLIAPTGQPLLEGADELGFKTYERRFPDWPSSSIEIGDRRILNPFATFYSLTLVIILALQLIVWLRRNRIQLLYTGSTLAHLIGAIARYPAHCKLIWHVHEIMSAQLLAGMGRYVFGTFARLTVDEVIVPSQAIADSMRVADKITVVPNGIDLAKFDSLSPTAFREEGRFPDDGILIGVIGRLTAWKGQRLLLEAAQQLIQSHDNCYFVIIGDAVFDTRDYSDSLIEMSEPHAEHIAFTGFRKDVPNVMNGLDIIVVPSLRPEPFGLVAVEGMACCKPIVGSNAGGLAEIVEHGETGLLFAPGQVKELVTALDQLITDADLRIRYGEAGRQRVEAHYTMACYGEGVKAVLHRVTQ